MSRYFDIERRRFLKTSLFSISSLALGTHLVSTPSVVAASVLDKASDQALKANLFVALRSDGIVEVTCHRSDMGQQIRTSIAQIVADEMEADWSKVKVIQGLGDSEYGDQNTDGSRSIRYNFQRLREMGASVRYMLEHAAAKRWNVAVETCRAQQHKVEHSSGKSLDFVELLNDVKELEPPETSKLTLKSRKEWRYIRQGMASVDLQDIVTGNTVFGADVREPAAKVAIIERPPVLLAKVKKLDVTAAKAVPGVLDIVQLPEQKVPVLFTPKGGVAVIAENTWAAMQGRKALKLEWDEGSNADYNSPEFKEQLFSEVRKSGSVFRKKGDVNKVLSEAKQKQPDTVHSAEYYIPHLNQTPMEPPCATALYKDGAVEIWSATQNPQADMQTVAGFLGIEQDKVTVHVTLLGGAFGRKSKPDFSAEAAFLSMKTKLPVRVQWTREDDVQHGFYHAVSAQRLEAVMTEKGKLEAFLHRTAFTPIASTFTAGATAPLSFELDLGCTDSPVDTPNILMESGNANVMTRIGWKRSVSNIFHAFAVQSFIAELAHKAKKDPKDFLLEFIGPDRIIDFAAQGANYANYGADAKDYPYDTSRLRAVIEKVSTMSEWSKKRPKGHGLGIAAHRSFTTYTATVVEVTVSDQGKLDIIKAWVAIDAGTVVNTDTVINQCQGGSIYGLSCALTSGITFKAGRVEQSNFHDYVVARMSDSPLDIDVEIIDSDAPPGGVGEPPTPPFVPALCNAIFAVTGKRIRQLPINNPLQV